MQPLSWPAYGHEVHRRQATEELRRWKHHADYGSRDRPGHTRDIGKSEASSSAYAHARGRQLQEEASITNWPPTKAWQ